MHSPRVNKLKNLFWYISPRHEGEGRMNWRTGRTKYSPSCPLVPTSGRKYRTVLTTGRDENTSCPLGTEQAINSNAVKCASYRHEVTGNSLSALLDSHPYHVHTHICLWLKTLGVYIMIVNLTFSHCFNVF